MKYYAEINGDGLCIGLQTAYKEIDDQRKVEIESHNMDYLWKKYSNGVWSSEKFPPEPLNSESVEEKIERLEQQIQQDNLIQFEVLATIYEELVLKG
jgi:hypothetical protein